MDREQLLQNEPDLLDLFRKLQHLHQHLDSGFQDALNRSVPFADAIGDRWERGKKLVYGANKNIYDSALIIGDVRIGKECWVGPQVILDGSGGLDIGNCCTISAGVQIYTHDNIRQTLSSKKLAIERAGVHIGDNVYIAPNVVITRGVQIGSNVIIGAFSFVNKDIESNSVVFGQPAKKTGDIVSIDEGRDFVINYNKNI